MSLNFCVSPIVSLLKWGYSFPGEKKTARKKVPFSSNHIRGTLHTHGISGDVNLDHAIEVVSARSLHCKATFYFPFPYPILWKQLTNSS